MRAAHRLRDGDWAKEIMALPANQNSKKGLNPATLLIAVELLAETGRPEEARELLKVRFGTLGWHWLGLARHFVRLGARTHSLLPAACKVRTLSGSPNFNPSFIFFGLHLAVYLLCICCVSACCCYRLRRPW